MKQQQSEFIKLQREIINKEMTQMPPEEVNDILLTMKFDEACKFLGELGRVRAVQIYRSLDGF